MKNEKQLTMFDPKIGLVVRGQFGQGLFVVKLTLFGELVVDCE